MSTLKQLVDETTNIKNELKTCHTNLKSNLIEKGVECSDADKLLSLVSKVGEIELGKKWATGSQSVAYSNEPHKIILNIDFEPQFAFVYTTETTQVVRMGFIQKQDTDITIGSKISLGVTGGYNIIHNNSKFTLSKEYISFSSYEGPISRKAEYVWLVIGQ